MKTAAFPRAPRATGRGAFTLIEILLVVAIMGIILGIGGPAILRALRKEGMRAAVGNVLDACQEARSGAILQHQTMWLEILPKTREFRVRPAEKAVAAPVMSEFEARTRRTTEVEELPPAKYSAVVPPEVSIELLDLNFLDVSGEDVIRVRFFANGTCDEFTVVMRSSQNEWRRISLDVLTGTPTLEAWR